MAYRTGLVLIALSAVVLAGAGACLSDLGAFPARPDASAELPGPTSGCGDGVVETLDDGGDTGESCDPGDAAAAGCVGCRIVCPGALAPSGHCYYWEPDNADYNSAANACKRSGGHLVTVASEDEAAFIAGIAPPDAGYWVGLLFRSDKGGYAPPLDFVSEPGWPDPTAGNSCPGCFAIGVDDAGVFAPESAGDATAPRGDCLVSTAQGWRAVPCSGTMRRTLCEREPIGERIYPCGGLLCTTLPINAGKKRYVVGTAKASAAEAAKTCADLGGSLAMFESSEEREQLVREVAERFASPTADVIEIWIGLSRRDGGWSWDDGVERLLPWGENQPGATSGERAYLRIDDTKFDTRLARADEDAASPERRIFACQRPPP